MHLDTPSLPSLFTFCSQDGVSIGFEAPNTSCDTLRDGARAAAQLRMHSNVSTSSVSLGASHRTFVSARHKQLFDAKCKLMQLSAPAMQIISRRGDAFEAASVLFFAIKAASRGSRIPQPIILAHLDLIDFVRGVDAAGYDEMTHSNAFSRFAKVFKMFHYAIDCAERHPDAAAAH